MSRSLWSARRERAAHLLRQAPHAEEMLVFYIGLTEIQERTAARVPVADWLEAVRSGDGLCLLATRIPEAELLGLFEVFLNRVADVGTAAIAEVARALIEAGGPELRTALTGAEGFHARAFLESVWTTLAASLDSPPRPDRSGRCPACGSLPVASVLQDLPEALGARILVCPLCATEWRTDRLKCAACGETSADRLQAHVADSVPWVRVDECLTCRRYLKTIDLRQRGDAVPVVDELATIELDVWARERGLTKVRTNVLEL